MRVALAILAVGIALMLVGFAYGVLSGAAIPYPDATPMQQAEYNGHMRVVDRLLAIGLVPTAAGALAAGLIGGLVLVKRLIWHREPGFRGHER